MRAFSTVLLSFLALSSTGCARPPVVASEQAACAIATDKVTTLRGLPRSHVALCDHLPEDAESADHYVLALKAHCTAEELCGSTNMGWFAIQKATGEVFAWDVGEGRAGARLAD